jgi:tRNA (guanine37-N1)-methyltransferase
VVNKLDSIDTQFRFFKMELLAGEPNYIVEHVRSPPFLCLLNTNHTKQSESDCRFTFDFSRVYWNSRLHTEHARLVDMFQPHELVADVFAGVGPFALPAAKKGCAVLANDLNPESYKYLTLNIKDNKVSRSHHIRCFATRICLIGF